MQKISFLFLITFLSLSFQVKAAESNELDFKSLFENARYEEAISLLASLKTNQLMLGQVSYLEGLCYFRLQEFDKAIESFKIAIDLKNENNDLYYEYGQSLFASNQLELARSAFINSAAKNFNPVPSMYYVAYISQQLEEYEKAKDIYLKVLNSKKITKNIAQMSSFQLAETNLIILTKKITNQSELKKEVFASVLPILNTAIKSDINSELAREIARRRDEIISEYSKKTQPRGFGGYLYQKAKFDNNVSLVNSENNISQTQKQSFIYESEGNLEYDLNIGKSYIITPAIRANFIQHSNQKEAEVFQNDSYSYVGNFKNKFIHSFNSAPASFTISLDYGKTYKDWNQKHKREFYSKTARVEIGESFKYFQTGDTNFKFSRKNYTGADTLISNHTNNLTFYQLFSLKSNNYLIFRIEYEDTDNFNNKTTNNAVYLNRIDFLVPEFLPKYTLGLALTSSLTDTKAEKSTRGMELLLNPNINITRSFGEHLNLSIDYDYTKNKSKQSDYNYQKHVISLELRYNF